MSPQDKLREFIQKHKKSLPIAIIIFIAVIIFIITYISTNGFYHTDGGNITTEYDPLSGQTIETINQENENNGEDIETPLLVGFDTYVKFGYTYDQYDILIKELRGYFKNNHSNIKRVSYIIDSIKYDDEEVSILYSDLVDNEGNKYTLITDTHNSFTNLQVVLLNSDKQEIFNSVK